MAGYAWDATRSQSHFHSEKNDEEMDFFTELALHETQRWIEVLTRQKFKHHDDPRASLQDGVLLCLLANVLRPGTVRKINRLPTPIAGFDNITVFLEGCRNHFGLQDSQLFTACDLEDPTRRKDFDCEEDLRIEVDRKLRGVAVTIFWLGKNARKWFDGPHLDLSAFTDLVHQGAPSVASTPSLASTPSRAPSTPEPGAISPIHNTSPKPVSPDLVSPVCVSPVCASPLLTHESSRLGHKRQESGESLDQSSAYGSIRSDTKNSQSSELQDHEDVSEHTRDNSYDSLISEDQSGLNSFGEDRCTEQPSDDGHVNDSNMPSRFNARQGSWTARPDGGAAAGGGGDGGGGGGGAMRYSATHDSTYSHHGAGGERDFHSMDHEKDEREDYNRFRFSVSGSGSNASSTENLHRVGGATGQNKSREFIPPTRVNSQKTSNVAYDPLQFIKGSGTTKMAEQAQKVVKKMEEQKHVKQVMTTEEDNWQSNLSNWKQKMRRKSTGAHQRTAESNELEQEQEAPRRRNKTFKEMMAERENRKSGSFMYSADNDDDEAEVFTEGHRKTRDRETDEDKLTAFGFTRADTADEQPKRGSTWRSHGREEQTSVQSQPEKDAGAVPIKEYGVVRTSPLTRTSPPGRQPAETEKEQVVERVNSRSTKLWSWERKKSEEEPEPGVASWAQDEDKTKPVRETQKSHPMENQQPNGMNSHMTTGVNQAAVSDNNQWSSQPNNTRWAEPSTNNSKQTTPPTTTTQNVTQKWSDSEQTPHTVVNKPWMVRNSTPSTVLNTKSRFETDTNVVRREIPVQHIHTTDHDHVTPQTSQPVSSPPEAPQWSRQVQSTYSPSQPSWREQQTTDSQPSWREQQTTDSQPSWREQQTTDSQPSWREQQTTDSQPSWREQQTTDSQPSWREQQTTESRPSWQEQQTTDSKPSWREQQTTGSEPTWREQQTPDSQPSRQEHQTTSTFDVKESKQDFVEKMIKISQKPNSEKGFGFTIRGGKEFAQPVVVDKVTLGSAADVCELMTGDEIVAVNGAEVANHYQGSVMHVITQAVRSGSIELLVRRSHDTDLDDSFEAEQLQASQNSPINRKSAHRHQQQQQQQQQQQPQEHQIEIRHQPMYHSSSQSPVVQQSSQDEDDKPPPLPTAPPPAPNWNTFPGSVSPGGNLDSESADHVEAAPSQSILRRTPEKTRTLHKDDSRLEILRRRSEFLGVNLEDLEEYKKIQAEEEEERSHPSQKVPTETRATSSILQDFHESSSREYQFGATDNSYHYKSDFELENQERRIIDNFGRGEEKDHSEMYNNGDQHSQQNQFLLDQEKMKQDHEDKMKQVKIGEEEFQKQEQVLLGPQLEHQRKLEAIRKTQQEQRQKVNEAKERQLKAREAEDLQRRRDQLLWEKAEERRARELEQRQEEERQKVRQEREQQEAAALKEANAFKERQLEDARAEAKRQQEEQDRVNRLLDEQDRQKRLQIEEQERREQERLLIEEGERKREQEAKKLAERELELKRKEEEISRAQELIKRERLRLDEERKKPIQTDRSYHSPPSPAHRPASWSSLPYAPIPAPAQTLMTESPKYTHPETHDISPAPEVRRSIRKEPPIPAKPSIKSELLQPKSLNVQTGTRQQEMSYTRPVVQARLSPSEGISRDEVLRMNRHQAAGLRQEWQARPHSHAESADGPRSPTQIPGNRRSLHNLSATPKPRYMQEGEWIVPDGERQKRDDQKRHQRHTEIMQNSMGSTSQHWVVEEAERRRKAESSGLERLQKLQNSWPEI